MRAQSVLVGFWVSLFSVLAFANAQGGGDPIDELTRPRTHNTGLQQRFAIPCPSGGRSSFASFADFFVACVHNGTNGGVLGQGFRGGGSYSGLSYFPSAQDRFVGKLVFRDYDLALEEVGRVLENGSLAAILNSLWLRGVAITDPSSLSSVVLTVYVPEPPPPPSSGGSDGRGGVSGSTGSGGGEWERARSLVRAVCSLSERVASLYWVMGAEPVKVRFYRRSDGVGFAGNALFMARVNALNRDSEAKQVHLVGLRNSGGWRGAYGEPSTGTLVSGLWNMFDRLSNAVSCRR